MKNKAMKRITCGWKLGGEKLCLKLAGSWLGAKTKYWSKQLGGRKKSMCLRRKRKPWLGYEFLCWLISNTHLFDQDQKLKIVIILPGGFYSELCNRQEIPSVMPSLPFCALLPSPVFCAQQPKWPKQLSPQGGGSQENMFYLHPMCLVSWHSKNNEESSYLKISGDFFTELF